jgi:xanthine dehydrogenase molybdenum-binding subunit
MKMGFKKDGTPVACDAKWVCDGGGYYTHASGTQYTLGAWLFGTYKFQNLRYKGERWYTNATPCGAYRGYGNPQNNFAMEQLIDKALKQLDLDPVDWRLKWHKGVGDDGWCAGVTYASCGVDECLQKGAEAFGWAEKRKKYANQTGSRRRGIGCAIMTHTSGAMPMLLEHTTCTVKVNEDATAEVMFSCSDLGTGAHTSLRQIAAETLGFSLDDIHIKAQDSDVSGFDIGAHASRTLYVGGNAVIEACEDAKRQILERAAQALEADAADLVMENKKVFVQGSPDKSVDVATICFQGVRNWIMPDTGDWIGVPGQIQGYSSYFAKHNSPPWGAAFAEVEVDTETGAFELIELVSASDVGKAIHPPSVEGQVEGGMQQGLGQACLEEIVYDENGLCLNNNFVDYKMFGPSDMPKSTTILVEEFDPHGPYGAKSVGESGQVAPTGAVANAIADALGVAVVKGPITPEKILQTIKKKGQTH